MKSGPLAETQAQQLLNKHLESWDFIIYYESQSSQAW